MSLTIEEKKNLFDSMLELIRVTSTQIPGDVQKEVLKALKREKRIPRRNTLWRSLIKILNWRDRNLNHSAKIQALLSFMLITPLDLTKVSLQKSMKKRSSMQLKKVT